MNLFRSIKIKHFKCNVGVRLLKFQKNVTFLMRPEPCTEGVKLVLMVSSGPSNILYR